MKDMTRTNFQKSQELLNGVKDYLQAMGKHLMKPVRFMLEHAEEVINSPNAIWDMDREPPQPACPICGGYLIIPKGSSQWVCTYKARGRTWHRLLERQRGQ